MEPMDIVGKSKEDASLPKERFLSRASMGGIALHWLRTVMSLRMDNGYCTRKQSIPMLLREVVIGKEFINLISSESNEVCNREDKRTIAPEHVLKALEVLGFGEYIEDVYAAYEQHKIETMHDSVKVGKWSNVAEMTEEEAAAEQQRMFAEARARMNGGAVVPKQPESNPTLES